MKIQDIKLKAEDIKLLKSVKSHLETAYKHGYTLPVYQSKLIMLNELHLKYVNKIPYSTSCSKCIMKLLKEMYVIAEANGIFTK